MVKKYLVNKFPHTRGKRINHKRNRTKRGGMGESMVEDIVEDIDMGDDKIDSLNRGFNAQYDEADEKNEDDQDIRDEDEEAHLYLNYFKDPEEIYEDYIKKRNDYNIDNPAEKLAKFYYDMGNREDKPTIISFFDYNAGIDYDFLLKNKDKDSMLNIIDRIDKPRFFENLFLSNEIYDGMPYGGFIPLFYKFFSDDFPKLLEKYVRELEPPSWVTVSTIQRWRSSPERIETVTLADLRDQSPEGRKKIDKLLWFCDVAVRFCEYYLNIHNSTSLDGLSGQLMRTFTVNEGCHANDTERKPWYTDWIIQRHKFTKKSEDIYKMRATCLEYFMERTFSLLKTCMQFSPTELPTSMNAMGLNYKKRKPRKSRKHRKPRQPRKPRKSRKPRQPRQHRKSRKHGTLKGMVRKDARLAYE